MTASSQVLPGMRIQLRHAATAAYLKSCAQNFTHLKSSQQQMVVATNEPSDTSTIWLVKSRHPNSTTPNSGLISASVVRLEHVDTKTNLHSHNAPSPILGDQSEVTTFGSYGNGDENDDWIVQPVTGNVWLTNQPIRLIHRKTNKNLHSHPASSPAFTAGYQEVTCFGGRDDNDLWEALIASSSSRDKSSEQEEKKQKLKTTNNPKASHQDDSSITERAQKHPIGAITLVAIAVAGITWCIAEKTVINMAERDAAYSEKQLAAEKERTNQQQQKLDALEGELSKKDVLLKRLMTEGGQNIPEGLARLIAENDNLRAEITKLQMLTADDRAKEWPALTEHQIDQWAKTMAPLKIKKLSIFWGPAVDAKKFYRSFVRLGERTGTAVEAGMGSTGRNKFFVSAKTGDPAGPILVTLLKEFNVQVELETGDAMAAEELAIFVGEKL